MITGDLRHDQIFLGRSQELSTLVHNLTAGRHTLLVGERGIGKSRLMLEARKVLLGNSHRIELLVGRGGVSGRTGVAPFNPARYHIVFVFHTTPMGDCLKEMAEQLHALGCLDVARDEERQDWQVIKKRLAGLGSMKLQALLLETLARSERKFLIFFDSLDRISPAQLGFVESVLNVAVVCAAVVQMKEGFLYKRIWPSFTRIEVGPLPECYLVEMIDYFVKNYPLRVIDPELFRREVLKASNGNPFLVRNLVWHTSRERHVGMAEIRTLRRVEEGPFFNMGPMYIFAASMFTIFKIFSLGTNNPEFYIYFSALGFLVYLTFRIFRTFFLFRPHRER